MSPWARKALIEYADQISQINVTRTEDAGSDNGHGSFRNSPWGSSNILMTLYYGLTPRQRGLIDENLPLYTFPSNFINRLWSAIEKVAPEFPNDYQKIKEAKARQSAFQ